MSTGHLLDAPVPEGFRPPVISLPVENDLQPPSDEDLITAIVCEDLEYFEKCIQDRNPTERKRLVALFYCQAEDALDRLVYKTG